MRSCAPNVVGVIDRGARDTVISGFQRPGARERNERSLAASHRDALDETGRLQAADGVVREALADAQHELERLGRVAPTRPSQLSACMGAGQAAQP